MNVIPLVQAFDSSCISRNLVLSLERYLETERFFCIKGFEIYSLSISEVSG